MTTRLDTGTDNYNVIMEDGEQVYPCRCGKTHRGPYAIYDYGHHNCEHPSPLVRFCDEQLICGECGLTWEFVDKRP